MADSSTLAAVEHVPETLSRCITDRITGTFNFEVTDYPQLKGMAVGEFISSRDFRVGGYVWRINFFPNGANAGCDGSASAYVQFASQGKDARAMFTLSVLERDGHEPIASHDSEQVFGSEINNDWGFAQFVAKSKLKSLSRRRREGCFTIRCVLTVTNESPPPDLLGHIESMLRDVSHLILSSCYILVIRCMVK
jgi:speckle-type POZ protein